MRSKLHLPAGLALALSVAPSCTSDPVGPTGPEAFDLAGARRVIVLPSGGVKVEVGGRAVFEMSAKARVTAARFDERAQGLTGTWTFSREGEERFALGAVATRAAEGDGAKVRFEGGAATGSITVTPYGASATKVVIEASIGGASPSSIAVPVACDADATFYGFGEQYNGADQRGEAFGLFVSEQGIGRRPDVPPGGINGDRHTTYFPMPYYLDARGFGLLAKTPYRTVVDLCKTDADVAWLEVESGAPVELVVFHGPTPLDVVRELGDELGRPTRPPPWAWDLWIGAQGGRAAVLADADRLEQSRIPAKVLWVQDWTGPRPNLDGGSGVQYRWVEDAAFYPDLAGMIASLHGRGYRFLSYANPFVVRGLEHFDEMASRGLLIKKADGQVYEHVAPNGSASHPDLTSPAARDYVKAALRRMVVTLGTDGWMSDFGEWLPLDAVYASGADPRAEHNLFPIRWHELWREVMNEVRPDGDFVVFARSGFTGAHKNAQVYWVGDQEADFSAYDGLPTVVPAMLTLGLSGIPVATHDIAGFSGGPSTKELFMRWAELGALSPIMRTHDGNKKDANWAWDKDAETTLHFRKMARLHAALRPDLERLADEAARTSAPMVRHLVLHHPGDAEARKVSDAYLLGEAILVAPVLEPGKTRRRVYLPAGAWWHVWSGARFEGGAFVEVDAPLGEPPIFTRDGDRPELRVVGD